MVTPAIKHTIYCYFILITLVICTLCASGQDNSQKLNRVISIHKSQVRLDSLLDAFSKQAQIGFSFNSKKIHPATVILVKNKKQTLAEWLSTLERDMGIHYTVLGDHIILVNDQPVSVKKLSSPRKRFAESGRNKTGITHSGNNEGKINSKQAPIPVGTEQSDLKPTMQKADTNKIKSDFFLSKDKIPVDSLLDTIKNKQQDRADTLRLNNNEIAKASDSNGVSQPVQGKEKDTIREERSIQKKQTPPLVKNSSFFIKPGISLSEVFYFSPTLEIGSRIFYGHISWNTNFSVSGLRYGAGTSIHLEDDLDLNIRVTLGKISRYFIIDTFHRILSKNKLTSVGFLLEKKLNNKWALQFGPVINYLSVYYYESGQPYTFSNPVKSSEKPYYVIKPPYFLSNNYTSGSVANLKLWVGLQVALIYNIPFL